MEKTFSISVTRSGGICTNSGHSCGNQHSCISSYTVIGGSGGLAEKVLLRWTSLEGFQGFSKVNKVELFFKVNS